MDIVGAACNPAYGGLYYRGRRLAELAGRGEENQSRAFPSVDRGAIDNGDNHGNDRNIELDPGRGDPSHACKLIDCRLYQKKRSEYNIKDLDAIVSLIFLT